MIVITLYHINASDITDIIHTIEDSGFERGIDFDFAYYPTKYDPYDYNERIPMHTDFTFYNEAAATFFRLKYNN